MKMISQLRVLSVTVFLLCAATPIFALTINDIDVPDSYLGILEKDFRVRNPGVSDDEAAKSMRDELVAGTLLYQESLKLGLDKEPENAARIEMIRRTNLANLAVQQYLKDHPPSEEEYLKAYKDLRDRNGNKTYTGRRIHTETQGQAKKIIDRLKAGEKFEALVKSENPSDPNEGAIPTQTKGTVFGPALAALKAGEFSTMPIDGPDGWQVFMLDKVEDISWQSVEVMKPQLRGLVEQQWVRAYVDDLKAHAKIVDPGGILKVVDVNKSAAPKKNSGKPEKKPAK